MSIKVKLITKVYGAQKAVDNISFDVSEGEILGFLGPNGAGKSTTMKIITGFIPPGSGRVEVCGYDVVDRPVDVKRNVGYLPEHNPLYLDMFVHEYLEFIGRIYGLKRSLLKARISKMIEMCGLGVEQNKKIGTLSKGYRQRVGLAQALINDPKVLILDEPTTGLDPNQILEIRNLIKTISKEKTVIFSTHIMQEVQALCSRAIIINRGKIVADNEVHKLQSDVASFKKLAVEFSERLEPALLLTIDGVEDVKEISAGTYHLYIKDDVDVRPKVFQFASENHKVLIGMKLEEGSLEHTFRELTR